MAERLGEKHPDMVKQKSAIESTEAKLAAELAKVVQSVRNEFLSAQSQERSLAEALNAQKADALSLNQRGIEYSVLRREAESSKQIYDALMQRAKETGISGDLKKNNIRIVDQAEMPRSPIRPNKTRDLSLGFLGGLLGAHRVGALHGVSGQPGQEPGRDQGVPRPEFSRSRSWPSREGPRCRTSAALDGCGAAELRRGVPHCPHEVCSSRRPSRARDPSSSRALSRRRARPSSTANLAVALAQTGQRVLLIDGDMRKPRQHEMFNLTQDPGLSSLLVGKAKANESVRKSAVNNLWIMPAGPNPPNPAELLGSQRFRDLLKTLGSHFEWVVIDSPPVMAVTDAAVIGHLTTGVVFVIGSEQVPRSTVRAAVDQLLGSKATILGAVLNRVNIRRNPYYYAHYYKHEYAGYYSAEKQAYEAKRPRL